MQIHRRSQKKLEIFEPFQTLRPFGDDIRKSLLRNIRIPQNLRNEFAHAFATCIRPSRPGLEFEANLHYINHIKALQTLVSKIF